MATMHPFLETSCPVVLKMPSGDTESCWITFASSSVNTQWTITVWLSKVSAEALGPRKTGWLTECWLQQGVWCEWLHLWELREPPRLGILQAEAQAFILESFFWISPQDLACTALRQKDESCTVNCQAQQWPQTLVLIPYGSVYSGKTWHPSTQYMSPSDSCPALGLGSKLSIV